MFEDTDSKEVKRDLKDDLKFCDRATQGPWEHRYNSEFSEIYANNSNASVAIVGHNPHDAEFIAQAREGWPHAIERALKAEALNRELAEALEVAFELLEDHQPNWYLRMHFNQINNALGSCKEVLGDDN